MAERTLIARVLGRSRRREFLLSFAAMIAVYLLGGATIGQLPTALVLLPVQVLIYVRRLHDFDARGWWTLAPFGIGIAFIAAPFVLVAAFPTLVMNFRFYEVIMVGAIWFIFLLTLAITPGTRRANRFGPAHGREAVMAEVFD
jgi:uncharacterized membrane protein YhaH (DUF805 family)